MPDIDMSGSTVVSSEGDPVWWNGSRWCRYPPEMEKLFPPAAVLRTVAAGVLDDLAARMAALTPAEQTEVLVKVISRRLRAPESRDAA